MSQYQSYGQRQQQQQNVPQPQNVQQRHVPTVQQTAHQYLYFLFLVMLQIQATIRVKLFSKPSFNGQVLEMVEEMLSSMENQILLF